MIRGTYEETGLMSTLYSLVEGKKLLRNIKHIKWRTPTFGQPADFFTKNRQNNTTISHEGGLI